ncbi:MAG TPA: TAXI family TRAP transporter solute-binding subunit [Nevskiaceae bacterium]|nr:TAXI family TRAP transporter solute-binding subunit [Nevskiaceae bacterium]
MSNTEQDDPASNGTQTPPSNHSAKRDKAVRRWLVRLRHFPHVSWRALAISAGPAVLIVAALAYVGFRLVRPPPHVLTISSGPVGSIFYTDAEKYQPILARQGITLRVVASEGSQQNLDRLTDPHSGIDLALVQSGIKADKPADNLVSLGSLFYEPLALFYRGSQPLSLLSQLRGRYIGVGAPGSGTHLLAMTLLRANGVEPGVQTHFEEIEGEAAAHALLSGRIGAVFLSADSATTAVFHTLMLAPDVHLFDFVQADAYVRRFRYLSALLVPAGTFNLGQNLPRTTIHLVAPTVELLAHADLHPALVDLLIQAAKQVNGQGSLLQRPGEFPAPLQHGWPIDEEAARFYKSGATLIYRYLPFWLASLINRTWLILVPLIVVLIPALEFAPTLYGWVVKNRIYRRYGQLMALERATLGPLTPEQRELLTSRLQDIEHDIIALKMPGAFANDLYILRQHVKFVRSQLAAAGR